MRLGIQEGSRVAAHIAGDSVTLWRETEAAENWEKLWESIHAFLREQAEPYMLRDTEEVDDEYWAMMERHWAEWETDLK